MVAPSTAIQGTADRLRVVVPRNEVLRDITRGGLAGLMSGIVLAGIGGRIVMRFAALVVPEATGRFTENGNRIGAITLDGTLALILFVGLFFGVVAGSLWVVVRPWLPRSTLGRALASIPIALALGTRGLVDAGNGDFALLGRDPVVIGSLVLLVALFGPVLALVDGWLERRLPHAGPGDTPLVITYLTVAILGAVLTAFAVVPAYLGSELRVAGVALVVVGLATLATWVASVRELTLPRWIPVVARSALTVAVLAGLWVSVDEVGTALGVR
jgi:hypothetical protein